MTSRFTTGDAVQTPFGKGVVREVRNNGRLLVDVHGHSLVVKDADISPIEATSQQPRVRVGTADRSSPLEPQRRDVPAEVDLHGLIVAEALARAEHALNDALLANLGELRLIHGRSGGRIRAALHQRLREIASVRGFHLDPDNEGVTIVRL